MIILYKACFNIARDDVLSSDPGPRPIVSNIQEMISVCVTSVVKQMTDNDQIIFFVDGDDPENILEKISLKYKVNFSIKKKSLKFFFIMDDQSVNKLKVIKDSL